MGEYEIKIVTAAVTIGLYAIFVFRDDLRMMLVAASLHSEKEVKLRTVDVSEEGIGIMTNATTGFEVGHKFKLNEEVGCHRRGTEFEVVRKTKASFHCWSIGAKKLK